MSPKLIHSWGAPGGAADRGATSAGGAVGASSTGVAVVPQTAERRVREPGHDEPRMRTHLEGCGACAEEAESLLSLILYPPR
jgi:hypothetical protein